MIAATLTVSDANQHSWDVIVIGAGVAGASSAIRMAQAGLQVLLVDAKAFPRPKVCGGCLNAKSIAQLQALEVLPELISVGAKQVREIRLMCGTHSAQWPMPETLSISRESMDAILVRKAIACGVALLTETTAHVEAAPVGEETEEQEAPNRRSRRVKLKSKQGTTVVAKARVVVCADGLGHPSLRLLPEFRCQVRKDSRIGIQATLQGDDVREAFPEGLLTMVAGKPGYVGLSRVEQGHLNMAAAIDPKYLSSARRPELLVQDLLKSCGLPVPNESDTVAWTGTPPLTQRSGKVADYRLFLVGDSTGYVEPFTGEGMAWALAASEALVPLVCAARESWAPELADRWPQLLHQKVVKNQWICRLLAGLLRRPTLAGWTLEVCRWAPSVPRSAMQRISGQTPPSRLAPTQA